MREFFTEVIYHIAKASNATRLYWYSLDRKVIYELAHNLLLQPTRYSARLSATLALMETTLRPAEGSDFEFSFTAKHQALGPHVAARWGWDDTFQLEFHRKRWGEKPWSIIMLGERPIGTVSVEETESHIRFGEFYLLPTHQGQGIGTRVLRSVLKRADARALPVKLEYLRWNPVGSLYKRHGFVVVEENDIHYFLVRYPISANFSSIGRAEARR